MLKVNGSGPAKARIVIVGEAPGLDEELEGKPFVGASGKLLSKLLREAGIRREECYLTYVCKYRPPNDDIEAWLTDKKRAATKEGWPLVNRRYAAPLVMEGVNSLLEEVASHEPEIVVGLGNAALWAFTGEWGVMDWRGSELCIKSGLWSGGFVPTLHPEAATGRWKIVSGKRTWTGKWEYQTYIAQDLKVRVARRLVKPPVEPQWDFNIAPSLREVRTFLIDVMNAGTAAVDVETSRGQIVCIGIAISNTQAMCIPFVSEGYGAYWSGEDRNTVLEMLRTTLHVIRIIGQNFNYDATYFLDNFGWRLRVAFDTKIAQNVLWPSVPANLGFLSSMYCDHHVYWKDDARDWQNLREFNRLFTYNCRDCCATFEIAQRQEKRLAALGLQTQFADRMKYAAYVFDMQERGMHRCDTITAELEAEIEEALQERAHIVNAVAERPVNIGSPLQVSKVLYTDKACRRPLRTPSGTSDEALQQVTKWHPEMAEFCTAVQEWRSLASVRNNFLRATLDPDGRLRSSFSTTGTETYRLTSSKNNFNRGTNLLNISGSGKSHSGVKLPNLRRAIVPPAGYTFFDCDLARADLQVVAWEAEDADLKAKFREHLDIHRENAKDLFGVAAPTPEQREKGKTFVHLTNYGGGARTCAISCGVTVHEADMAQRRWFAAHPGILEWHKRTRALLQSSRMAVNKFGYRITFFDRIDDSTWRDALAWVPQSTIAIVASHVHMRMEDETDVEVLLQMYDSVAGVYPTVDEPQLLPLLHKATQIVIPYDDPLIVPMGIKTSTVSWGDCKERKGGWTT